MFHFSSYKHQIILYSLRNRGTLLNGFLQNKIQKKIKVVDLQEFKEKKTNTHQKQKKAQELLHWVKSHNPWTWLKKSNSQYKPKRQLICTLNKL